MPSKRFYQIIERHSEYLEKAEDYQLPRKKYIYLKCKKCGNIDSSINYGNQICRICKREEQFPLQRKEYI